MNGFQYRSPGTIIFRSGSAGDPETFKILAHTGRTLIVTDSNLQELGIVGKVRTALEGAGADVVVYDKVEAEPSAATVRDVAESARSQSVDRVVGLGGGSPMDVAKIAALLIPCPQPMDSMYEMGQIEGTRLPLTLIPTTAGTGSEGTAVAVVTGDNGEKRSVISPQCICDAAILDAELTLGVPPLVTAATGVDAMVHAVEACTSALRKNPVSDQLALKAMGLLHGNIRRVMAQGQDVEARGNMLAGAMMAGLAFANATVGSVHALAYGVGTKFHLSHGESNSLVFAPVMRFNLPEAVSHYAEIARAILPKYTGAGDMEAAQGLIEEIAQLVPEVGLKDRLSDCGVGEGDLDAITDATLKQTRILSYNIRPMNRDDILGIFRSVL